MMIIRRTFSVNPYRHSEHAEDDFGGSDAVKNQEVRKFFKDEGSDSSRSQLAADSS